MTDIGPLWIRADANRKIGLGHLMRCLALAQAWRDLGGLVTFVMAEPVPALAPRFEAEHIRTIVHGEEPGSEADLRATVEAVRREGATRVVLDGYHFTSAFQQALRAAGAAVMTVDDNGEVGEYVSEWVFNQNLHAHESLYPRRAAYTQLLLGAPHVLLRRDFVARGRGERSIAPVAKRVVVTLGGGDHDNVTEQIVLALDSIDPARTPLALRVIVGAANPHFDRLQDVVARLRHPTELLRNVDDMRALMLWADFAVTGGGSTCWEACFLGLPFATVVVADNQRAIAEKLDALGAAKNLGWFSSLERGPLSSTLEAIIEDPERRRAMSEAARTLIDGRGAERTARALLATPALLST
jgi:UDP-2,4-diacetamido-2,4,6-trideoxy-beta-L-altropyranose hydrolase